MYLVHPSDHADARLSGLLRYMKPFLVQISQTVWEMTARAAEGITHRLWSLLDKDATHLQECVHVCAGHLLSLITVIPALTFWPQHGLSVWLGQQNRGSRWLELWTDGSTVFSWLNALTRVCLFTAGMNRLRGPGAAQHGSTYSDTVNLERDRHSSTWHGKPQTLSDYLFTVMSQHSKM